MDSTGSVLLMGLVIWPAVILLAALLNMLISWTFSWSELAVDYLVGVLVGLSFSYGAGPDASAAGHFFLTVSHGLIGLLKAAGVGFLADPDTFLAVSATGIVGVTAISAALDRVAETTVGSPGGIVLSCFQVLLKAPFALMTSTVGLLVGLIGMIYRAASGGSSSGNPVAFAGGALFFEWGMSGTHATTFGWMVNVFRGTTKDVVGHELYHTRQYVYLHDWLGVFYFTVAGLWGLVSSAIAAGSSPSKSFEVSHYYQGEKSGGAEVGNPLEVAAYGKYG